MKHRIIGTYTGEQRGPLVIVFGALHGNEPAGVRALEAVLQLLEKESSLHPTFGFRGKLMGFLGNRRAFERGQRFLKNDLNRLWTLENVQRIRQSPAESLDAEDLEIAELDAAIRAEIKAYRPTQLVFLDLHTTSAEGGIFSIPTGGADSLALAKALRVPAILGLQESIPGTLLRFAAEGGFSDVSDLRSVAFEGGQHEDAHSVGRSVSAILHCLRAVGCMRAEDVDSRHDALLEAHSAGLPKVVRMCYAHDIVPEDQFRMRPGYTNFQPVRKGEHLADEVSGPVFSPLDALILMPLYQSKGSDGFFLVQEVSNHT
jgi:succinylglutamate desuccinylase